MYVLYSVFTQFIFLNPLVWYCVRGNTSQYINNDLGCSSTGGSLLHAAFWWLCCQSSGGTQKMSTVEHIDQISRKWWQSWWSQFSQVRATGRTALTQHDGHYKVHYFRWRWQMQLQSMLWGYLGQNCLSFGRFVSVVCRICPVWEIMQALENTPICFGVFCKVQETRWYVVFVLLGRQQRGKGWCRHPTGWMLDGEHILRVSYPWPNHSYETSDWQGNLCNQICLCRQSGHLDAERKSRSCSNSYIRDSRRCLKWLCWQIQCWIWGSQWRTWLGTRNTEGESVLQPGNLQHLF